jgi:hypothetical protein
MEVEIIKNILQFYLDKEKEESEDYKYFIFKHFIGNSDDYLSDFDDLCHKNVIILKTKLNINDSKTIFFLLRYLFDDKTKDYLDLMEDFLIPEIEKKEDIDDINIYDTTKYIDEWINYTNSLFNDDEFIVFEKNKIPSVKLYDNHQLLYDLNVALQNSQKIMTIQDIIELSG